MFCSVMATSGVADPGKRGVGALVAFTALRSVLAVSMLPMLCPDGQAEVSPCFRKMSRALCAPASASSYGQVNQVHQRAADSAAHLEFHAQAIVNVQSRW